MRRALLLAAWLLTLGCSHGRPPQGGPPRVDLLGDPLPAGVLTRLGSVRLDCEDTIRSAVFAPDGKSLSVTTSAREKQLWFLDVATGKTIRRLARAVLEGTTFLRDNRATAVAIIAEWSDVDAALAGELYDLARDSYTLNGRIDDAAMKTAIEAQIGYQPGAPIDLQRFVDWSLLPSP